MSSRHLLQQAVYISKLLQSPLDIGLMLLVLAQMLLEIRVVLMHLPEVFINPVKVSIGGVPLLGLLFDGVLSSRLSFFSTTA